MRSKKEVGVMYNMGKTICVLGTFDTKSQEFKYLIDRIHALGANTITLDAGFHTVGSIDADYPVEKVIHAGESDIESVRLLHRNEGMAIVIKGAKVIVRELLSQKAIHGIIGMGGSGGTTLCSAVMQDLPIGFPKVIISTLGGSGKIAQYVGGKDITIINSVVDVSGINSVTERVFCEGAGAVVGAAMGAYSGSHVQKPRIAATMYGLTTPCVTAAKEYLEDKGYEVIVFHATGSGGKAMESLIRDGFFKGVLDVTLPEIYSYVLNVSSSNPGEGRLKNATQMGIPIVVCPGAMDMVSTSDFNQYPGRKIYCHNTTPSHFRPNKEDAKLAAKYITDALNQSKGPCAFYFPHGGLSMIDLPGEIMYDPEVDHVLCESIQKELNEVVEFHESDLDINCREFAIMMARRLDEMIHNLNK